MGGLVAVLSPTDGLLLRWCGHSHSGRHRRSRWRLRLGDVRHRRGGVRMLKMRGHLQLTVGSYPHPCPNTIRRWGSNGNDMSRSRRNDTVHLKRLSVSIDDRRRSLHTDTTHRCPLHLPCGRKLQINAGRWDMHRAIGVDIVARSQRSTVRQHCHFLGCHVAKGRLELLNLLSGHWYPLSSLKVSLRERGSRVRGRHRRKVIAISGHAQRDW